MNPLASSGRGFRLYPRISKLLRDAGVRFDPLFIEHPFHAVELAVSAVGEGYRKIAIIGGDGTLHDVVNGLFIQKIVDPKEVTVALLSTSRPRGWKRAYGNRVSYAQMVDAIANEQTRLQDVGVVRYEESQYCQERCMASVASVGFYALIVKRFTHLRNKGAKHPVRYAFNLLRALFRYRSSGARVWVDDQLVYDKHLMSIGVSVSGCSRCAKGMQSVDSSNDGLFDITLVEPVSFWSILFNIRKLFLGKTPSLGRTTTLQGSKIHIESIPNMPLEVDGEVLGDTPIEFHIIEEALRMVVTCGQ